MIQEELHKLKGGYCVDINNYSRFTTREVQIGDLRLGGNNPIRIQSMTTTDTMDTEATVAQSIRMIEAGCELVRITAPSIKEAENLAEIKKQLRLRGYNVPLVADIHFTPNAAEVAARIVEKVRVNPGNYADKKKFESIDYTQAAYDAELERIRAKFVPLIKICKEYGTAMRIGTNHGSLSDRIMSHYGDTPLGMVESAMEFIRICEAENYHNLVISMKASNTQVMVQAYRLLVKTMVAEGMNYPLHLGVTEAGDGEDGRIKSAVGIGTLLEDGLGDTIRVSLTEEPEAEIPVAKILVDKYAHKPSTVAPLHSENTVFNYDPYTYSRRSTEPILNIGGTNAPIVMLDISKQNLKDPFILSEIGYSYSALLDKYNLKDQAADIVFLGDQLPSFSLPGALKKVYHYSTWKTLNDTSNSYPYISIQDIAEAGLSAELNFIEWDAADCKSLGKIQKLAAIKAPFVLVMTSLSAHGMAEQRAAFSSLIGAGIKVPVIIKRSYETSSDDFLMLRASTDFGALLTDGFGDGLWINGPHALQLLNATSFGILQATRTRISKTEYISCPSCGRTLFDLQETTQMIRAKTDHLKGVKIGIMGCIVNGPGEMADADYGYVGTGPDKITLYRGREVVKKSVHSSKALDELINLIKEDGVWVEKNIE